LAKEVGMTVIRADSRWRALGAASVAVAVSLAAGSSAAAAGPVCGDTISSSTTLRSDLRDCPGDGLVIGADDITLNLNGHMIDGDAVSGGDNVGVRVDGHQGVVIRHGTVQEFDHAVRLTGSSHNQVVHLVATRNGDVDVGRAILVDSGSDQNLIARNDASGNGRSGIAVLDSHNNVVAFNRTARNGVAGMGIFGGSENRVIANVVSDNADNGIAWGNGTTGGVVARNRISGNPGGGLGIEGDGANVLHNRLIANGDNFIVFGNHNLVRANLAKDASAGFGVSVEGGTGNVVTANIVLGAARDGIRVDTFAPDDFPTTDTVIRRNLVRGVGVDGISVGTETTNPVINTRIEHNRVSRSTDDGIDVLRAETVLLGNLANHNGDLGISATPGTIDAGGNRAHRNGNPAQCVGVVCA
jgi:parallel beta-helix repeat protein